METVMKVCGAVWSGIITTALYYAAVSVMNEKYELGLAKKKGWISSEIVTGVGGITFLAVVGIACIRLSEAGWPMYLLTLILTGGVAALAVTDYIARILPNQFLLLMLLLWIAVTGMAIIVNPEDGMALLFQSMAGGMAGGLIFLLCYLMSGKQLGAGDVKLAFIMGLYLTGQRIIGAVFYGVLLGCVYSLVQIARKKLGLKDGIPLAPFLYLGMLITFFII